MRNNYARCRKNVCKLAETDAKHNRTRSSILIEINGNHLLVDVSADFRQQALREHIPKIDAVLITHTHADHIGGIPDIRSYNRPELLPFYGSPESMEAIRSAFGYIFSEKTIVGGGIPHISLNPVCQPFSLWDTTITPIPVQHGGLAGCMGYRIGSLAYIPDMKTMANDSKQLLRGLDCLILNCLRDTPAHPTHLILEESMQFARDLEPKSCFFIHMSHDINYVTDAATLENGMSFAYDGLSIDV
jgi:phosphoribosyl 1,2-cyclic phosphate phosphodiesterase